MAAKRATQYRITIAYMQMSTAELYCWNSASSSKDIHISIEIHILWGYRQINWNHIKDCVCADFSPYRHNFNSFFCFYIFIRLFASSYFRFDSLRAFSSICFDSPFISLVRRWFNCMECALRQMYNWKSHLCIQQSQRFCLTHTQHLFI